MLEVGCGEGHVARVVEGRGHRVLGVEADSTACRRAREVGVRVVRACWPEFASRTVDAVAFTRVLHHVAPVEAAVLRAVECLRPGGLLLLEDFAHEAATGSDLAWFRDLLERPEPRRLLLPEPGEFVTVLREGRKPETAWEERHGADVHRFSRVLEPLEQQVEIRRLESAPYLYRYLLSVLPATEEAGEFMQAVFLEESERGARGDLSLIGRRVVARVREPGPVWTEAG